MFDKGLTLHDSNHSTFVVLKINRVEVFKGNSIYSQTNRAKGFREAGGLPGEYHTYAPQRAACVRYS